MTIATIKVSVAIIVKPNCATKLNASNVVIQSPPSRLERWPTAHYVFVVTAIILT